MQTTRPSWTRSDRGWRPTMRTLRRIRRFPSPPPGGADHAKAEPRYRALRLAAVRGIPVTIAAGAHDEFIAGEHPAYLAQTIPWAKLQVLADAGHFAPWQQPQVFNRAILAFLRSAPSP